jgi:glyoxylase-like metal-dependent hydrolase (beta-lactamase superfamily II)
VLRLASLWLTVLLVGDRDAAWGSGGTLFSGGAIFSGDEVFSGITVFSDDGGRMWWSSKRGYRR